MAVFFSEPDPEDASGPLDEVGSDLADFFSEPEDCPLSDDSELFEPAPSVPESPASDVLLFPLRLSVL